MNKEKLAIDQELMLLRASMCHAMPRLWLSVLML